MNNTLPPAPVYEPVTTVERGVINSKGKQSVFFTSLMWVEWFNKLIGMFTYGGSDHDAMSVSLMTKQDGGAIEEVVKEVKGNKVEEIMRRDEYGDVEEVRNMAHNMDEKITMMSVSLEEIEKAKHDAMVMIIMGGAP